MQQSNAIELKDIVAKLRNYEIRIRKAINSQMQGDYHSIFKGSGLEFDDVRAYHYGDDIRHIDWNVSAKGHGTFVKTFKEEKEQNVFFILDVSASQNIGKPKEQKLDIAKEICGVLALSAAKEASSTGVLCYTDQKERYVRPNKGPKHAYLIIREIFNLKPSSKQTNLKKAMASAMSFLKRRSLVIIVSDFVDTGYERNLKAIARKHDLVVIHVADPREGKLPSLGIVPLLDKESGKTIWVNTSSSAFRGGINQFFSENSSTLSNLCLRNNANYLPISTQEDFVPKLIKLFKVRNKIKK